MWLLVLMVTMWIVLITALCVIMPQTLVPLHVLHWFNFARCHYAQACRAQPPPPTTPPPTSTSTTAWDGLIIAGANAAIVPRRTFPFRHTDHIQLGPIKDGFFQNSGSKHPQPPKLQAMVPRTGAIPVGTKGYTNEFQFLMPTEDRQHFSKHGTLTLITALADLVIDVDLADLHNKHGDLCRLIQEYKDELDQRLPHLRLTPVATKQLLLAVDALMNRCQQGIDETSFIDAMFTAKSIVPSRKRRAIPAGNYSNPMSSLGTKATAFLHVNTSTVVQPQHRRMVNPRETDTPTVDHRHETVNPHGTSTSKDVPPQGLHDSLVTPIFSRVRRFIGGVIAGATYLASVAGSYIFGTTYASSAAINSLASNQQKLTAALSADDHKAAINTADIAALKDAVTNDMAEFVSQESLITAFLYLSNEIHDHLATFETRIDNFYHILAHKTLPPTFIPFSIIRSQLEHLITLVKNLNLRFDFDHLSDVYMQPISYVLFTNFTFRVAVHLPLRPENYMFSLYRYITIPLPVTNLSYSYLGIYPDKPFLALGPGETSYFDMSDNDLDDCVEINSHFQCRSQFVVYHSPTPICVASLFFNELNNIAETCPTRLIPHISSAYPLSGYSFIVLHDQREKLRIKCSNGSASTVRYEQTFRGLRELILPRSCRAESDFFSVAPHEILAEKEQLFVREAFNLSDAMFLSEDAAAKVAAATLDHKVPLVYTEPELGLEEIKQGWAWYVYAQFGLILGIILVIVAFCCFIRNGHGTCWGLPCPAWFTKCCSRPGYSHPPGPSRPEERIPLQEQPNPNPNPAPNPNPNPTPASASTVPTTTTTSPGATST